MNSRCCLSHSPQTFDINDHSRMRIRQEDYDKFFKNEGQIFYPLYVFIFDSCFSHLVEYHPHFTSPCHISMENTCISPRIRIPFVVSSLQSKLIFNAIDSMKWLDLNTRFIE